MILKIIFKWINVSEKHYYCVCLFNKFLRKCLKLILIKTITYKNKTDYAFYSANNDLTSILQ